MSCTKHDVGVLILLYIFTVDKAFCDLWTCIYCIEKVCSVFCAYLCTDYIHQVNAFYSLHKMSFLTFLWDFGYPLSVTSSVFQEFFSIVWFEWMYISIFFFNLKHQGKWEKFKIPEKSWLVFHQTKKNTTWN